MVRTTCFILLASTMSSPVFAADDQTSEVDCYKMRYTAGHAHALIDQGFSLNKTLSAFSTDKYTRAIITELYVNKDEIEDSRAAGFVGDRMCRSLSASL